MNLTPDGIRTIVGMTSPSSDPSFQPVLQAISIKNVGSSNDTKRYRAVLSDGTHFVQGMVATQLNDMIDSKELQVNTCFTVEDFMNNSVQGRNVIILLKISVVGTPDRRIGSPTDIEKAGNKAMDNDGQGKPAPMYNRTNTPANNAYASAKNPYSPPSNRSTGPIVHTGVQGTPGGTPITLISQLNMYQSRWTLKARLVSKSDIRTWSNAKGEGQLFSVELLDNSGMDIRGTFFKDAVVKFYNLLQVGSVYHISGGRIKVANMQYNTCKSQHELTFDSNSEIRLVDDAGDIQAQSFDLVKIADLERVESGKNVDVLGIVQEVGDVQSLTSKKTGKELQKSEVTLVDETGVQVKLTLWGKQAINAQNDIKPNSAVAFRRARVSDFGGVSLSGGNATVEPNIPEASTLKEWWETQGKSGGVVKSLSSSGGGGGGRMDSFADRKTVADIKNQNLGYNSEKADYISFKAHFTFLKQDKEGGAWYTACPNTEDPCRNRCKVTQTTDGNWQCERCHGTYDKCNRKWIFSATLADDSSTAWVSMFDEQATALLGATADDIYDQYDNQDLYDGTFKKAYYSEWIFKCRVKSETVNDEARVKTQVVRMDPVDYVSECKDMLAEIQKFQ